MPTTDFTSKLLELKEAIITNLEQNNETIKIYFRLQRRDHVCPCCGAITNKVHDYRTSEIRDIPIQGKKTLLIYSKQRYHCDSCNKHFYETFAHTGKGCRTTHRLAFYAIHLLCDHQSVHAVAGHLGISDSYIFRRMKNVKFPKPKTLPQVLSIDEFKGNAGGQKFQAILTDPKNHKVLDILKSRTQTTLIDYFKPYQNRKNVTHFVMDMNYAYREFAESFFPNAKIVIDKFHVVRYVTWALENVRKRVQKEMHPDRRKYFKRSRRLLLTHKEKLKEDSLSALAVMLSLSEDLATAYHLKECFYEFISSKNRSEAERRLRKFILATEVSQLTEFKATLTMLSNWSKYILNAFDCNYTNGFTEGTNNKIKVIKRNAFGYRNFNNFRNRILLACN